MQPSDLTPGFPHPVLQIRPWLDPIVDQLGHDPRSHYVEHFWLGVLGPSTTFLLRRLAAGLDVEPEGYPLDLAETAQAIGLAARGGRHSPFMRALTRTCRFGLARLHRDCLEVRRRIPPLTILQVQRLPGSLQDEHRRWQESQLAPHRREVIAARPAPAGLDGPS